MLKLFHTGNVECKAEITEGNYNSNQLLNEIKNKMNLVETSLSNDENLIYNIFDIIESNTNKIVFNHY